jgi:hypothetical protein
MDDELIDVFELSMHGSTVTDQLKSNLLSMIECEIENMESEELEELEITIVRKKMLQSEYESLPEFDGF